MAFVQDFFGVEQSIRQALSDPSVRMFMHSLGTHGTHYALDEDRIRGHSSQGMAGQAAASLQWHSILGLDSCHIAAMDGSTVFGQTLPLAAPPPVQQINEPALARLDVTPVLSTTPRTGSLSPIVPAHWFPRLQEFGLSSFKSPAQAQAIQMVAEADRDAFVVMKTGGGKSLLVTLPLLAMPPGSLLVLVIPSRALRTTVPDKLRSVLAGAKIPRQGGSGRRAKCQGRVKHGEAWLS